jgi:cytochrome c
MRAESFRYVILPLFVVLAITTASAAPVLPHAPAGPQRTPPPGNSIRGADIYEAKCSACHSLDANRIGPKHRGVFGRKSGGVRDFHYSLALGRLDVVWGVETLDRWLKNPTAMAPGTTMGYRLAGAQDRADVIAYLKHQSFRH